MKPARIAVLCIAAVAAIGLALVVRAMGSSSNEPAAPAAAPGGLTDEAIGKLQKLADLRNKAAAMGGNVVQAQSTLNGTHPYSSGAISSTVIGNVYACPGK